MVWSLFHQSGVSPRSWANNVLADGRWPQSSANAQSLIAWALLEGGGGQFNPLNTTFTEPGSTDFNSVGVKNYTSWTQGVQATLSTIRGGNYQQIVNDLKSGMGIGSTSELSTWSGGGYDSLSATWNEAAGYMGGKTGPLPQGNSPTPAQTTSIFSNLGGDFINSVLGDIGLPNLTDMLERLGLILLGAALVIIGIIIMAGGKNITTALTVAAPEAKATQVATGATGRAARAKTEKAARQAS